MLNILLVVHIIISILLVITILIQKTSNDSIASSSVNNLGTTISPNTFLTRTTSVLAIFFMINALVLANLSTKKTTNYIIEKSSSEEEKQTTLPIAK